MTQAKHGIERWNTKEELDHVRELGTGKHSDNIPVKMTGRKQLLINYKNALKKVPHTCFNRATVLKEVDRILASIG